MPSPEYLAGMTTPMHHPKTGNKIAGAAAHAAREKQAGGPVASRDKYAAQALAAFVELLQPKFDSLNKMASNQQLMLEQLKTLHRSNG